MTTLKRRLLAGSCDKVAIQLKRIYLFGILYHSQFIGHGAVRKELDLVLLEMSGKFNIFT